MYINIALVVFVLCAVSKTMRVVAAFALFVFLCYVLPRMLGT